MKKWMLGATAAAVLCAGAVTAQDLGDPATIVNARHGYMDMMAMSLGTLGAMAKGQVAYDATAAKTAANNLALLAALDTSMLWVAGTENGVAAGSYARPETMTNTADRQDKFDKLKSAADGMVTAAGTDAAAIGAAMNELGGACGECHKQYRKPDE